MVYFCRLTILPASYPVSRAVSIVSEKGVNELIETLARYMVNDIFFQ
jgi:hypothetical protein